jgi:hypothetical protein
MRSFVVVSALWIACVVSHQALIQFYAFEGLENMVFGTIKFGRV